MIYNPYAGKLQRNPGWIPHAIDILKPRFGSITPHPTTGPDTAGAIARVEIERGATRILAAGGDGTINEVISGMAGTGVPLGILPAGTANVLGMETRIGGNLLHAAARFDSLVECEVALGVLTFGESAPRHFLLMCGVGLDARIVRLVRPETKRRWGKLSYWEGGFAQVGKKLPEFEVRMNGQTHHASYALISRVKNYGGDLEIARHANLLDNEFAVVLFEGPSSLRYLKYFSGVLVNSLRHMSGVTVATARAVELSPLGSSPEIDVQIDGEWAGIAPARVEISSLRLRMLLPEKFVRQNEALTVANSV